MKKELKKQKEQVIVGAVCIIFGLITLVYSFTQEFSKELIIVSVMLLIIGIVWVILSYKKLKLLKDEDLMYKDLSFVPKNLYEQMVCDYRKGKISGYFQNYIDGYKIEVEEFYEFKQIQICFNASFHTIFLNISQDESYFALELNEEMEYVLYDKGENENALYPKEKLDEMLYADNLFDLEIQKDELYNSYAELSKIVINQEKVFEELLEYYNSIKM